MVPEVERALDLLEWQRLDVMRKTKKISILQWPLATD